MNGEKRLEQDMRRYEEEHDHVWDDVLEVNEKELHDVLTTWCHIGQEEMVTKIKIAENEIMTAEDREDWEWLVNKVLRDLRELDCKFHDEFGCAEGRRTPRSNGGVE